MNNDHNPEVLSTYSKEFIISLLMAKQTQVERLKKLCQSQQHQITRLTRQVALMEQSGQNGRPTLKAGNQFTEAGKVLQNPHKNTRHTGKRNADLKGFPETVINHELTTEQLTCFCGGNYRKIGEDVYSRLKFHPAYFEVEKHHVAAYSCRKCQSMVRARRPAELLPNSIATPSLTASVLNSRYHHIVPLNRLETEFRRYGLSLTRQTMANWINRCCENYLSLLHDRLKKESPGSPAKPNNKTTDAGKGPVVLYEQGNSTDIIAYSIAQTASANHLNPYRYFKYLLEEIPKHMTDTNLSFLEKLLPWSADLPEACRNNFRLAPT